MLAGRGFATAAVVFLFVLAFIAISRRFGKGEQRSRRALTSVVLAVVSLAVVLAFVFGR